MVTRTAGDAISAVDAFRLAGIPYRQLDYWARRGWVWVQPSVESGTGRPGRRLYSADDLVRLAALGPLGRSGADVGVLGPQIVTLKLPPRGDYLVVLRADHGFEVVASADLRAAVAILGGYVVFDPAALRRQLGSSPAPAVVGGPRYPGGGVTSRHGRPV